MIRKLSPDELTWFIAQAFGFLEHGDSQGFARKVFRKMIDLDIEAGRCLILQSELWPRAGVTVLAPEKDAANQNLYLANFWVKNQIEDIGILLEHIQDKYPWEAMYYPLYNHNQALINELRTVFEPRGFSLIDEFELVFELSELPPLGRPLILEAWTHSSDKYFKEIYEKSEGRSVSDEYWAYLKRRKGAFNPNLWFLLREGLDQMPIGYAFYGAKSFAIDGVYYQTEVGVLAEYRDSSEMLKRLVLSSLHELAAISPFGHVDTTVSGDLKLKQIFEELGFDSSNSYQAFVKLPK